MSRLETLSTAARAVRRSCHVFAKDVGHGLLDISHNVFAMVGLAAVAAAAFTYSQAELRAEFEVNALQWLQSRHEGRELASGNVLSALAEPEAVNRATAADLKDLSLQQASVAIWISRRYKVATEPVSALVQEAWSIGSKSGLDPALILAIVAVESRFNPFAQSPVGAQGLMQVMTHVHDGKYESFGGRRAAFDPITNLRVGVQVLKECIARAGSVQEGLRFYVGAALLDHDNGYASRVMAEQQHMHQVMQGVKVPFNVSNQPAVVRDGGQQGAVRETAPASPVTPNADKEEVALLSTGLR